jgi:hypothetical protein
MFLFIEVAAAVPEHLEEKVIINTCILLHVHFVGVLKT